MRISDWSSDVCSSDLGAFCRRAAPRQKAPPSGAASRRRSVGAFFWRGYKHSLGWALAHGRFMMLPIGRASCRERVCQYVSFSLVAVSLKLKQCTSTLTPILTTTLSLYHLSYLP